MQMYKMKECMLTKWVKYISDVKNSPLLCLKFMEKLTQQLEEISRIAEKIQKLALDAQQGDEKNIPFFIDAIRIETFNIYHNLHHSPVTSPEKVQPVVEKQKTEPKLPVFEEEIDPFASLEKSIVEAEESLTATEEIIPDPPATEEKPKQKEEMVPVQKDAEKPKQTSNEKVAKPNLVSLNEKLTQNSKVDLFQKHQETPIKDLTKAISISKKFEFINELFGAKPEDYKDALAMIESSANAEEATKKIKEKYAAAHEWAENEKLENELYTLIRRRFL